MKKLSKLIAISLCILMMTVLFTGCSKKEQEQINFFNYGENIDDETIKEFEKTYNIKVNMETFDDMEAMYQKINYSLSGIILTVLFPSTSFFSVRASIIPSSTISTGASNVLNKTPSSIASEISCLVAVISSKSRHKQHKPLQHRFFLQF